MATIDLGKIKFVNKGAYDNNTAYTPDDIVTSGGSSYICKLASTGNAVTNGTYWDVLAQGGTDVGATLTTQGDLLFRDGSGLQRLAKGTANQELRMNSGATAPEWYTPAGAGLDCLHVTNEETGNVNQDTTTKWVSWETPKVNDFGNSWNGTTGEFTIPTTGSYFINCYMGFGHHGNSTRYHGGRMYVDGSHPAETADGYISTFARITSNSVRDSGYVQTTGIVTLNANQVLSWYLYVNDEGASNDNHRKKARLSIMKI